MILEEAGTNIILEQIRANNFLIYFYVDSGTGSKEQLLSDFLFRCSSGIEPIVCVTFTNYRPMTSHGETSDSLLYHSMYYNWIKYINKMSPFMKHLCLKLSF